VSPHRRAVFLDRDGTLNIERELIREPAELELIPRSAAALRELQEAGFLLIVVTNQSAVARGSIAEVELEAVHQHLRELLAAEGVSLEDILYCPHHPTEGDPPMRMSCECRKPEPGLLLAGAAKHHIKLTESWMIGDTLHDIKAGQRAGTRCLMVKTGKGAAESAEVDSAMVVDDLSAAAALILAQR